MGVADRAQGRAVQLGEDDPVEALAAGAVSSVAGWLVPQVRSELDAAAADDQDG